MVDYWTEKTAAWCKPKGWDSEAVTQMTAIGYEW